MPGAARLAWHGCACDLPRDWEVTAYHLDANKGEFRLNRRIEPVAQLTWSAMRGQPDVPGLLQELHRRWGDAKGEPVREGAEEPCGPWCVLRPRERAPVRAACWHPDGRFLAWAFGSAREDEWRPLLQSSRIELASQEREWAIFGLRARLPALWQPDQLIALPANVILTAEGRRRGRIAVRRLGLAEHQLAGLTLEDFYLRRLRSEGCRVDELSPGEHLGHPAVRAGFTRRGEHAMEQVLGRRWPGQGLLWHDRGLKRLVSAEVWGPRGAVLPEVGHVVPA